MTATGCLIVSRKVCPDSSLIITRKSSENILKVATAMEYLESMNIVHGDLAARNILVGRKVDDIKVSLARLIMNCVNERKTE